MLEALRDQERQELFRKESEERRGYIIGGLATVASGIGISVMIGTLAATPGTWTVGLIPLLVGVVLTGAGLTRRPPTAPDGTRQG